MSSNKAPVYDVIIVAVARVVDDAQSGIREPSHSNLEFQINRAGLNDGDPKGQGQIVGKAKRVRATLSWGIDNPPDEAEAFIAALIGLIGGKGGFRAGSSNFVSEEAILDAREAFRLERLVLSDDGELYASTLDNLSGVQMIAALEVYLRRAQRGIEPAPPLGHVVWIVEELGINSTLDFQRAIHLSHVIACEAVQICASPTFLLSEGHSAFADQRRALFRSRFQYAENPLQCP